MLSSHCRRVWTSACTRLYGATSSLGHLPALGALNLHSVHRRNGVASSCLVYPHPLCLKPPPFYSTVGLQTVGMASWSEESGSQRVESEDRLEYSPEEGRGHTTTRGEECPQPVPGGSMVQDEGGEEMGQGEQEGPVRDCRGGEGLLPDDSRQDGSHQMGEGVEWEDEQEMGEPSSGRGRGEGPEADGEGGAGPMDVQQSGKGEAVAEGLIPHGKFTSEIYKIEIRNLPKVGFGTLRNYLHKLNLDPVKFKYKIIPSKNSVAFVTFRNEAARELALRKLDGLSWKGKILKAKYARATEDPYLKKQREDSEGSGDESSGSAAKRPRIDARPPEDRMTEAVTPLWNMAYEEQLQYKMEQATKAVRGIARAVRVAGECEWLHEQQKQNKGLICPVEQIVPSPSQFFYRNKCEFTIGPSPDGKDNTLGFRIGSYREADLSVVPPSSCLHVPEKTKEIVKVAQQCISDSTYGSFNPVNHTGHWTMCSVRCYHSGETMVVFQFHPQDLPKEEVEKECERVKAFFATGPGSSQNLNSVFFHVQGRRMPGQEPSGAHHLLLGSEHVHEAVLGLKFRISNEAFFQVNTSAAEVLYKTAQEWCGVQPSSTLYDICCGTGTIGLTMANSVKKVIGVELIPQAIEDAKVNAQINKIDNAEFHCGKAEDILPELVAKESSDDVVGILDPPRGGMNTRVIKAIRKCEGLNRLVYLACSPENSSTVANFVGLCRARTKKTPGRPFRPTRALPVDMFPHTNHYELILLFEREPVNAPVKATVKVPVEATVEGPLDTPVEGPLEGPLDEPTAAGPDADTA